MWDLESLVRLNEKCYKEWVDKGSKAEVPQPPLPRRGGVLISMAPKNQES